MPFRWFSQSRSFNAVAVRFGAIGLGVLISGSVWHFTISNDSSAELVSNANQVSSIPNGGLQVVEADLEFGTHWENERNQEGEGVASGSFRLRNPTANDVLIEKFDYPCAVGRVADRKPVLVPANGEIEVKIEFCPKRSMVFRSSQLVVEQVIPIQPVIPAIPGRHPGWQVRRKLRAAMLATNKVTLSSQPGNVGKPTATFDLARVIESEAIEAVYDREKLSVRIEPKSPNTFAVSIQPVTENLPRDFWETVEFRCPLGEGKSSMHLVDVFASQ